MMRRVCRPIPQTYAFTLGSRRPRTELSVTLVTGVAGDPDDSCGAVMGVLSVLGVPGRMWFGDNHA